MAPPSSERAQRWAGTVNLLLPGGGLILLGATWSGWLVGFLFVASANLALAASLLFPDDFSSRAQSLLIGLAAGCYIGAQVRVAQSLRQRRATEFQARRAEHLRQAQEHMQRGDARAARAALEPLAADAAHDLLVAYRLAQVLTAAGDAEAARAAWARVRALDRHRVYRQQIEEGERAVAE